MKPLILSIVLSVLHIGASSRSRYYGAVPVYDSQRTNHSKYLRPSTSSLPMRTTLQATSAPKHPRALAFNEQSSPKKRVTFKSSKQPMMGLPRSSAMKYYPQATSMKDLMSEQSQRETNTEKVEDGLMVADTMGGGGGGGDDGGDGGGGGGGGGGGSSGYFQYAKVPQNGTYEFGYRKGNPYHFTERHESRHGPRFRTKVHWGDKHGGYGEHYWEYNHVETTPAPTTPGYPMDRDSQYD